jgi:hypothetical protein
MVWWEALVLGVVQGLTEFFPVSSSGHLVMGNALLGLDTPGILFEVAVQRRWPLVVERKDVIYNLLTPLEDSLLKEGTQWVG